MRHCRRHTAYAAMISIFPTLTPAIKAQEPDSVMYTQETIAAAALGESVMPTLTLEQLTVLPSPEAWAMSRHNDETVDLATGTGRLDIPLFSWQAGDLAMSLSLSCRLGSFRARESAGWIGLGWTLNGGGCVTRTIMGLPDEQGPLDIKTSSWIGSTSHIGESVQYIKDMEDMRVDAMADRYSYSCPGASGEFLVIGGSIIQTPPTNNKIELTGTERDGVRDFLVTTPDGIVIQKYEYALAVEAADGLTRVRTRSRLNDSGTGSGTWSTVTTIYDGFGLPVMDLKEGYGSGNENVGTVTCYDALHRTVRQWRPLPVDSEADVLYNDNGLTQASMSLYGDGTAFTAMTYPGYATEQWSSLSLPGSDFAQHPTTVTRGCSSVSNTDFKVMRYSFDGNILSSGGYYSGGELDCQVETTPDGYRTMTFTDALGHVVLTRRDAGDGKFADTYTVSDSWGNPLIVLSPEASAQLTATNSSWGITTDAIDKLAFIYAYDSRLRPRSVKIPGCGSTRYAYDREGRLAYTRDARQAEDGIRTFHIYDALGREAVTGICNDSNPNIWTTDLSSSTTPMTASRTAKARQGLAGSGYTASTGVAPYAELLTANYYDDYGFLPSGWTSAETDAPAGALSLSKGNMTGTLTAVLGETDSDPLLTVITYRKGGIPVRTESECLGGGRNIVTTEISVSGLPITVRDNLRNSGQDALSLVTTFGYDAFGRETQCTVQTSMGIITPAGTGKSVTYDAVGNPVSESLGAYTLNYSRNIRGNISEINSTQFSQKLYYGNGGKNSDWIGRVTGKETIMDSKTRRYDYAYSPLGFLLSADYAGSTASQDYSEAFAFDLNANIKNIERHGLRENGEWGLIYNKTISRSGNMPREVRNPPAPPRPVALETRTASSTRPEQPTSFTFDVNGCMTEDKTRGIDRITYNILNLPERIEFSSGDTIHYVYMADGRKIQERYVSSDGLSDRTREYHGCRTFVDGALKRTETVFGYSGGLVNFVYIKDYQGNVVRVLNASVASPYSVQTSDYYAYGLPHGDAVNADTNRNKFGGKEYMTEFGLDEYDYRARRQDPLLGHFSTPDPFAIVNPSISPWAFCNGDPVNFIDPTGEMVIYNKSGEYMGHSSEGFTGDVYIYTGDEQVDFSQFTESQIKNNYDVTPFDSMRGGCLDSERLSGDAMSKIWTHIVSQFEGTTVYDEKFSINRIPKGKISYEKNHSQKVNSESGGWKTWYDKNLKPSHIIGTGSYLYETTVENVSSSVIVHEWYSHQIKGVNDDLKSHRLAYKNVINYKALWNNTTNAYKAFVLKQLRSYTYGETGRMNVDPPYRNLYNKYVK